LASGITSSGSKNSVIPRPSQAGQAPKGLLKENRRGSTSSMVKPETGQANLAEKVVRSPFFLASSVKARPSARCSAVSKESARRVSMPSRTMRRSTTTSMSCFFFLSSAGAASIS
jgi:hypothetical protein